MSISNYSNKVKNITPKEVVENKYYLGNMEIKNNGELKKIAINYAKQTNNNNIEEVYNKLRSQIKVVSTTNIVPSNDYKVSLLQEKSKLISTKKDILSTLNEVRLFKEEFNNEFNDYLDSNEFYNYYLEIESIENRLVREEEKSNLLNNQIDTTILENDKKIAEIEKIDLENKKKKQEEKKKKEETKQQQNSIQNNNQLNTQNSNQLNNQNNNQMNNNLYEQYMNMYSTYMMSNEYEEEKTRGRSR